MAQTPRQRQANDKFAKTEAAKRGKVETVTKQTKEKAKSPISMTWIVVLGFVLAGGAIFELLRLFGL